ncbi:MAG: alpha/beta fold hydrolase [Myxococcota bacterium]
MSHARIRRPGAIDHDAPARLFCLPPAGGGASTFYPLMALDSERIEICPVALPGREGRFKEPIPDSLPTLAALLVEDLSSLLDRRYAILGYSMGGLLAWEFSQYCRRMGLPEPEALFPIGARAPHRPFADGEPLSPLPGKAFLEALDRLGGMPKEILSRPDVMDIFEPILRADLRNCEDYRYRDVPALDARIHATVGTRDALVTLEDVDAWSELTLGDYERLTLDTPHMIGRDLLVQVGVRLIDGWLDAPPRLISTF